MIGGSLVLVFGGFGGALILSGGGLQVIPWPILVIAAAALALGEWFALRAITPPTLRADALEVSAVAPLTAQRMPRADVRLILRAQLRRQGRGGPYWEKDYVFAGSDGRLGISCAADAYQDAGIAEFAQRLGVPLRGDFSAQVTDRVDPASA